MVKSRLQAPPSSRRKTFFAQVDPEGTSLNGTADSSSRSKAPRMVLPDYKRRACYATLLGRHVTFLKPAEKKGLFWATSLNIALQVAIGSFSSLDSDAAAAPKAKKAS